MQQEEEQQVAIGGAFTRRAGCLLVPVIPVRAAGALVVTTKRIVFDPVLHYKLFARKIEIDLANVEGVEVSGSNVNFTAMELVTFGKNLTLKLRDGTKQVFRSNQADELAAVISGLLGRFRR